jgi:hypothetical protein
MVNFGGYLRAVRDVKIDGLELYFVPYNILKEMIFTSLEEFEAGWMEALEQSCKDFTQGVQSIWSFLFSVVSQVQEESRGAPLGNALHMYVEKASPEEGRETLQRMVKLQTAAASNSEALRKLIKKHDKYNASKPLSASLLPCLYASSVFTGQSLLQDSVETLRELLINEETMFLPLKRNDSDAVHLSMVESRVEELNWLKRLIASIPQTHISGLVAHRGFHHIKDRSDKRPLENSLAAYELAWTSGIHLCECDIALTKDEVLVLAHDEDFKRLALEDSMSASMKVSDLTFRELISLPLKSGMRPPLLIDVLRSAHAISDNARLIIEIKPGNAATASALARLLFRHPELCSCVQMIMSFDAFTMHRLRMEFASVQVSSNGGPSSPPGRASLTSLRPLNSSHRRLVSMDHFGNMGLSPNPSTAVLDAPAGNKLGLPPKSINSHRRLQSEANSSLLVGAGVDLSEAFATDDVGSRLDDRTHMSGGTSKGRFPQLMLLTVSSPSARPCDMFVSVNNLSVVDSWLAREDGALDGVYLQFEKDMMTKEGAVALQELSKRYLVGVWGSSGRDPDDLPTFDWLKTKCNVTYVNTDLPNHFSKEIIKRR